MVMSDTLWDNNGFNIVDPQYANEALTVIRAAI